MLKRKIPVLTWALWKTEVTAALFGSMIKLGFLGIDFSKTQSALWDAGERKFVRMNLNTIGKALVTCLSEGCYEETKGQSVRVGSGFSS